MILYIYGIPELAPKHSKGFIHPFSMVKSPPRALPFAENTIFHTHIRMFPKIGVEIPPKMHGENHGKTYEQIDDLFFSHIFGNTLIFLSKTTF